MWHFTKLQADILPGILSDILSGIISDMFTFQFHYLDLFAIYPEIYSEIASGTPPGALAGNLFWFTSSCIAWHVTSPWHSRLHWHPIWHLIWHLVRHSMTVYLKVFRSGEFQKGCPILSGPRKPQSDKPTNLAILFGSGEPAGLPSFSRLASPKKFESRW